MARIPKNRIVIITLPSGEARITLREPTIEELNAYQAERLDLRPGSAPADRLTQAKKAQAQFFDLLITSVENLEDDQGPVTPERKDVIPASWKHDAVLQQFDLSPVSVGKN